MVPVPSNLWLKSYGNKVSGSKLTIVNNFKFTTTHITTSFCQKDLSLLCFHFMGPKQWFLGHKLGSVSASNFH